MAKYDDIGYSYYDKNGHYRFVPYGDIKQVFVDKTTYRRICEKIDGPTADNIPGENTVTLDTGVIVRYVWKEYNNWKIVAIEENDDDENRRIVKTYY